MLAGSCLHSCLTVDFVCFKISRRTCMMLHRQQLKLCKKLHQQRLLFAVWGKLNTWPSMLWACCLTYLLCFFRVQNGISHSWEGVMRPALKPSQLHYRWAESAGSSVCIAAGKCEPSSSSSLQFRCHWELHRETCSFHGKACKETCSCHRKACREESCSCHGKCLCFHRVGWYSIALKSGGRFPYKPKNKGQPAWQWRKSTTKNSWLYLTGTPVRHQEFIAH